MSAAADAHRSAHAHASPARAAAHAAPAAGWLGASASLDELPSPPSLSPLRTTGVMPAAAATGALPAAAASRLVATAAASMSEGWSPSASPPLCAISAQPRASAATAAGADAPSLALTNRIELLPISPAEFGRAPSYLRSEFDFMQLNEYLARISHAIAQRAAALRAGAVDLALDVWTAEALASATGLSPLNAPADGGARACRGGAAPRARPAARSVHASVRLTRPCDSPVFAPCSRPARARAQAAARSRSRASRRCSSSSRTRGARSPSGKAHWQRATGSYSSDG